MITESIAGKLAISIISKLMSWGFNQITKSEFTPYEKELTKVIQQSIDEYEKLYPIHETERIPFYQSYTLFEELIKFRFTSVLNKELVLTTIRRDERIIPPSEGQLLKFFEIFNKYIKKSETLAALNLDSNYKEEIFKISEGLEEIKDLFLNSINEIKGQLNALPLISSLVEEWSKQLDEILGNIQHFKPITARERLYKLEERIREAGLETDKKLFSRIYSMHAECLGQIGGIDIIQEEANYLVKAYNYNKSNIPFKANAALGYYVLNDKSQAQQLAIELLENDQYDAVGWLIKTFFKEEKFEEALYDVPDFVKTKKQFTIHLYHWLRSKQYIKAITDFEDLGLKIQFNPSEPFKITYLNRQYNLITASYILSKFYEGSKTFNSGIYYPRAKQDQGFLYAREILSKVLEAVRGSEIENSHHYYTFQLCCANLILDGDISHVHEMEKEFKQLVVKPLDVVIRMAQAYNNLDNELATKKSAEIIEKYDGEQNELLILLNLINYSILEETSKIEEYFSKYVDFYDNLDKAFVINTISFFRKGQIIFSEALKEKLEYAMSNKPFGSEFVKNIFQIFLYIAFKIGFASDEIFFKHLKAVEQAIGELEEQELFIHIAYGYAHIEKYDDGLAFLKSRISFDKPSEGYKLYCKILYKSEGHKPELLEHLKKWRVNFNVLDFELMEMEIYFAELQKNWGEVTRIAKTALSKYPKVEKFIYYLFYGMHQALDIDGIRTNVNLLKNLSFQEETFGINVSIALIKAGLHTEALEILFNQASQKSNIQSRQFYISLSIQFPRNYFEDYEVVEEGTFVKYIIDDKKYIRHIDTCNKNVFPQNVLVGKRVGDVFSYQKPVMGALETGTILRVCNKYLALFEEIMVEAESPMSGLNIHVMQFDGNTVEEMSQTFIKNFGAQGTLEKERVEEEFKKYFSGSISFSELTNSVFKRNFIDAYFLLVGDDTKLFKAISPSILSSPNFTSSTKFVLDFTSCCLFFDLFKNLKISFDKKFIISGLLRDEVIRKLEDEKISPKTELSITITTDSVRPHFYADDFKEKRIEHLQSLFEWIEENCEVADVPERLNYIMSLKEEHKNDSYFQILIENKLLADRPNHVLLSNDIFYYRHFHCPISIVLTPWHYLHQYHFENSKEITEFLLSKHYIGIPISADILNDELFKMLSGRQSQFTICLENLKYNWNPNNSHIGESIKFVKSLYLSSVLNDAIRQQTIVTVFSNLLVGLPIRTAKLIPNLIMREFKLLPQQMLEVLDILTQIVQFRQ